MEQFIKKSRLYSFRFASFAMAFLMVFIFQYALINPELLLAQETTTGPTDTQAQDFVNQTNTTTAGERGDTPDAFESATVATVSGAASCALGGYLSSVIQSAVSSILGGIIDISNEVPTKERIYRAKEAGGLTSGPSWDSIGFCLVNTIINYIAESTIQWINSGFQGNPVFVEDPARFFRNIADIEAGSLVGEITGGAFCKPFRPQIAINLANRHTQNFSNQFANQCRLSNVVDNVEDFMGGFEKGDWNSFFVLTTDPSSNPRIASIRANRELDLRIAGKQEVARIELNWGKGFLSFKDPETGETTTPGTLIENRINDRLGSNERRIEMADEFDEIITALVNQLLKVALNEVLTSSN